MSFVKNKREAKENAYNLKWKLWKCCASSISIFGHFWHYRDHEILGMWGRQLVRCLKNILDSVKKKEIRF